MNKLSVMAALILVMGYAPAHADDDARKNTAAGVLEVLAHESSEYLQIIYRGGNVKERVKVSLYCGKWLIYHHLANESSFIQRCNLSNLADGDYTFEVKTRKGKSVRTLSILNGRVSQQGGM